MEKIAASCIPIVSTAFGSALTNQDLETIGISQVAYRLADLLQKPGLSTLTSMPVSSYIPWKKHWILDTTTIHIKNHSVFVHSPYSGMKEYIALEVIMDLIHALNPTYVILHPLLPADKLERPRIDAMEFQLKNPEYDIEQAAKGVIWFEEENAWGTLSDLIFQQDYRTLATTCCCEACVLSLSRAYFHHLFEHTQGLCQRYLIQHALATFQRVKENHDDIPTCV